MITNHEEETYELTYDELKLAKQLIPAFELRTKENPIIASEIVRRVNLTMNLPFKFSDVRLRKIVNYYRVHSILPVMSCSRGYYVSRDKEEIKTMMVSLQERANSIQRCVDGLNNFLNK